MPAGLLLIRRTLSHTGAKYPQRWSHSLSKVLGHGFRSPGSPKPNQRRPSHAELRDVRVPSRVLAQHWVDKQRSCDLHKIMKFDDEAVDTGVSASAYKRLKSAKASFSEHLSLCDDLYDQPGSTVVRKDLIHPRQQYLTQTCGTLFRQFVLDHGCKVKRVLLSPDEKRQLNITAEKRHYWHLITVPPRLERRRMLAKQQAEQGGSK